MYLEKKMGLSVTQQFTDAWTSSGTIHRWGYRQYRSQSVFKTSAECFPWHCYMFVSSTYYHRKPSKTVTHMSLLNVVIISDMSIIIFIIKHPHHYGRKVMLDLCLTVLMGEPGRLCVGEQAGLPALCVFLGNTSVVLQWARTVGLIFQHQQGWTLQLSLGGGGDAAVPLRRRCLHHFEKLLENQANVTETVGHAGPDWRGYENCVQPRGSRHTDHPSHHPCSELRILQHCDQHLKKNYYYYYFLFI